jgi:hypothetical protein
MYIVNIDGGDQFIAKHSQAIYDELEEEYGRRESPTKFPDSSGTIHIEWFGDNQVVNVTAIPAEPRG